MNFLVICGVDSVFHLNGHKNVLATIVSDVLLWYDVHGSLCPKRDEVLWWSPFNFSVSACQVGTQAFDNKDRKSVV